MNDLEREVREALLRHQDDAPPFDLSDARRSAGRARRRQARNVIVGIAGAAAVIGALAGLGGLVRADPSSTVIAPASSSPTCEATPGPDDAKAEVHGWPSSARNRAGVYSWDDHQDPTYYSIEGFMHNTYRPGSGLVDIYFLGTPGRLSLHRGDYAVTVAGCEWSYHPGEWEADIQGTTVTLRVVAEPGAPEAELAEAHRIIESIRIEPQDNDLGFRLDFTLTTNTWDSG